MSLAIGEAIIQGLLQPFIAPPGASTNWYDLFVERQATIREYFEQFFGISLRLAKPSSTTLFP